MEEIIFLCNIIGQDTVILFIIFLDVFCINVIKYFDVSRICFAGLTKNTYFYAS